MDLAEIRKQMDDLHSWLHENAPNIAEEQKHLDAGSEAQKYWHYGRLIALNDILRMHSH